MFKWIKKNTTTSTISNEHKIMILESQLELKEEIIQKLKGDILMLTQMLEAEMIVIPDDMKCNSDTEELIQILGTEWYFKTEIAALKASVYSCNKVNAENRMLLQQILDKLNNH